MQVRGEEGHEICLLADGFDEMLVDHVHGGGDAAALDAALPEERANDAHDERGARAVSRDVGDDHAHDVVADLEIVEIVAAGFP